MSCSAYMLASKPNGTLYAGVTNDLVRRVYEHQNHLNDGFTSRYSVHRLVWFEITDSIEAAIQREKQLKNWKRDWKIALIEKDNPIGRICIHRYCDSAKIDPGSSPG